MSDGPFRFADGEVVEACFVTPAELRRRLAAHRFVPDSVALLDAALSDPAVSGAHTPASHQRRAGDAPMSMIGADVEQLAGLGRTLSNQVQSIETMMSTVGARCGNTLWRGPARDAFEADWTNVFVKALTSLNDAFSAAGQDCATRSSELARVMGR